MLISSLLLLIAVVASFNRSRGFWSTFVWSVAFFIYIFFSLLYFVADYFTDEGINDAVIFHLKYGLEGAGVEEYYFVIFLALFLLVSFFLICYFYFRKLRGYAPIKTSYTRMIIAKVTFLLGLIIHPTSMAIISLVSSSMQNGIKSISEVETQERFKAYYKEPELKEKKRVYNLVYIYMESLEKRYFDNKTFPNLLPRLTKLKSESIDFQNIEQVKDTGWTIAGMVSSQCALPLVTPSNGNSMSGMPTFYGGATCIGDLLDKQGYHLSMMQGSSIEFSGIDNFYKTHQFDEVEGKKILRKKMEDKSYLNHWGLYDDTLLDFSFRKFEELSKNYKNFALYLATIDTHHPNGHEAKSCEKFRYKDGSNPMLNAVHCTDILVSQFVEKIQNSQYGKDTVIVFSSDHLAMKNSATSLLKLKDRRDTFFILTPDGRVESINKKASMLDVAPTILDIMGFDISAMGLGRNLLREQSLTAQIDNFNAHLALWKNNISQFWNFQKVSELLTIKKSYNQIILNGMPYRLPLLLKIDENRTAIPYFEFDSPIKLYDHLKGFDKNDVFLWVDDCYRIESLKHYGKEGKTCYIYGKLGAKLFGKNLTENSSVSLKSLEGIYKEVISDNIAQERKHRLETLTKELEESLLHKIYRVSRGYIMGDVYE
jgi:phosphoglycerol transferase